MTAGADSSGQNAFGELGLSLDFTGAEVVVHVRGEVDILTAPDLAVVLDALLARGHTNIALDLGGLEFIDGSGLQVIADVSTRLRPVSGVLVLRSTRSRTRQVFEISGVSDLVQFEHADPPVVLGPEQTTGDGSGSVSSRPRGASSELARLAAIPASEDVVDAALRLVVALARSTVDGADGVSVSLSRHGQVETVASSDETIAQMDRDQYATGQGPCLAAAAEGRWFHVASLSEETRWPEFIPRAVEGGIASILSTPLMVANRPVGALNIYSNTEGAFGGPEQELAALFATQASGILSDAGAEISSEQAGQRLGDALRSREVIAQAQGVLMERDGVSADEAYVAMRSSARYAGAPVRRIAGDLLSSTAHQPGAKS